jgi:hypothetical protein
MVEGICQESSMGWLKVVIRTGLLLAMCMSALAVAVARLVPRVDPAPHGLRRPTQLHFVEINNYSVPNDKGCRFLDPQTGNVLSIELDGADSLLFGNSSPWVDDDGQTEVVGRWISRRGTGGWGDEVQQIGLARFKFPSGKALDHIPLDIVPAGNPCWFPDKTSRVLYAGTDGQLYRVEFPNEATSSGEDLDLAPEVVAWKCPKPGKGDVRVGDPTWPADPRMKGRVVVSLTYVEDAESKSNYLPEQIWWLQLDDQAKSIVAAGRLSSPRTDRLGRQVQERLPSLARTADNEVVMAYLSRPVGQTPWDLHLARLVFHPLTGEPRARTRAGARVASNVVVTFPVFSADGSWVHGIRLPVRALAHAERFSVTEALPPRSELRLGWHAPSGRAASRRSGNGGVFRTGRWERSADKS